jgi:arylsulfatase A-like enzyme
VRITAELAPVKIRETSPGTWLFDLDRAITGVARLKVQGHANQTITLRFAANLKADGTLDRSGLRGARATDRFTCSGLGGGTAGGGAGRDGFETFEPRFTLHDFRYVEVTGLSEPPTEKTITGVGRRRAAIIAAMVSSVLVALLLPGLAACASAQQAAAAAPQKPRSLLVVTFDTTRRDCMGFLGESPSVTPNLDKLAARSCVFTDAYTVAPITLPAHCSLMTGLYPISHGVHENTSFKLPQTAVTLAEILKQHGYATAATVGAIVLDPMFGLDQGFDHYDSPNRRDAHVGINVAERHADEQADLALKEIAALAPKAPFFYWVHFFDPHFPYEAPEHLAVTPGVAALPDEMARHAYLEELWYADKHFGRVLDQLESQGLAKELVVVFAADHGESLGDTPEPAHGYFLFDPTVRIPLLIRDPAQAPRRVETQASLVDVVPTVLDLLGVPADPELRFDGADLAPIVRGTTGEGPERALLLETRMTALNFGWAPFDGCVQERMKYVHSARDELFDRKADPEEKASDPEERARRRWSAGAALIVAGRQARATAELDEGSAAR